jgi:uncharacterized protein YecT (DUF1311 family)
MGKELFASISVIIGIASSFFAPAMAQNAGRAASFPEEVNCDAPTLTEIEDCTRGQATLWDKSLNAEYKSALERVTEDSRSLLVKAQRLWVQYRDANCAVDFAQGGTVAVYYGENCILNMTRERARELRGAGVQ